jgi:polyketide cyclase/dehydrase/lipid transport protein
VWAVVADLDGQPRWMHDMKDVRVEPGPVGVGTRGIATVRIFGMSTRDPVRVTAFEPPRRFSIEHLGTFTGHGDLTLEPGADGTTTIVRWDETLIAPALPHVWATIAEPLMTAIFQADLRRLRDLAESGA